MSQYAKLIVVLFFAIFLSNCSTGKNLVSSDKIKPGMTKLDVEWILASRALIHQTAIPAGYREYFSNLKKEILSDERKQVYYVYKNVYTPVKLSLIHI